MKLFSFSSRFIFFHLNFIFSSQNLSFSGNMPPRPKKIANETLAAAYSEQRMSPCHRTQIKKANSVSLDTTHQMFHLQSVYKIKNKKCIRNDHCSSQEGTRRDTRMYTHTNIDRKSTKTVAIKIKEIIFSGFISCLKAWNLL